MRVPATMTDISQPLFPAPADADVVYSREIGVDILVSYVRLWETSAADDPWPTATSSGTMLSSLRSYWNANMTVREGARGPATARRVRAATRLSGGCSSRAAAQLGAEPLPARLPSRTCLPSRPRPAPAPSC